VQLHTDNGSNIALALRNLDWTRTSCFSHALQLSVEKAVTLHCTAKAISSWSAAIIICGHHIYKEIWTPVTGKVLTCDQEHGNSKDLLAISVTNDGDIFGHMPRE